MLYAIVDGEKTLAQKNTQGKCPECETKVIPKCGPIKINHWAHKTVVDCVYEGETEWHREWKSLFPKEWVEIKIDGLRADILLPGGLVVELQSKTLSIDDMLLREKKYKKMVWFLNCSYFYNHFVFYERTYGYTFRWKWPHTRWGFATQPIVFDFNNNSINANYVDGLFKWDCFIVKKIYFDTLCHGWGVSENRASFYDIIKKVGYDYEFNR